MARLLVVDKEAGWFVNIGAFSFTDPSTGVCFEPGVETQVKQSDWMKGQPVIAPVVQEVPKESPKPAEAPKAPAASK